MAHHSLETLTFSYHVGTTCFGLFKHPYKTMQGVVRLHIPGTITLFPLLCWVIGYGVLRLLDTVLFRFIPFIGFWWFFFVWGSLFFALWQLLLLYLHLRFTRSLKSE